MREILQRLDLMHLGAEMKSMKGHCLHLLGWPEVTEDIQGQQLGRQVHMKWGRAKTKWNLQGFPSTHRDKLKPMKASNPVNHTSASACLQSREGTGIL